MAIINPIYGLAWTLREYIHEREPRAHLCGVRRHHRHRRRPESVTLKYKSGAGSVTTVTYPSPPIVKDSTGNYHADLDTTGWSGPDALLYATEWAGTGTVQAIGSDYFQVTPAAL